MGKRKAARKRKQRKEKRQSEFMEEARQERLEARRLVEETSSRIARLELDLAKARKALALNSAAFEQIAEMAESGAPGGGWPGRRPRTRVVYRYRRYRPTGMERWVRRRKEIRHGMGS